MSESEALRPHQAEIIERYEHYRALPTTLEKLESARDMRELLRFRPEGIFHGGFRYSYSKTDADVVRIKWVMYGNSSNSYRPPVRAGTRYGAVGAVITGRERRLKHE